MMGSEPFLPCCHHLARIGKHSIIEVVLVSIIVIVVIEVLSVVVNAIVLLAMPGVEVELLVVRN